jgi:hypothetical protein
MLEYWLLKVKTKFIGGLLKVLTLGLLKILIFVTVCSVD